MRHFYAYFESVSFLDEIGISDKIYFKSDIMILCHKIVTPKKTKLKK